MALRDPFPNPPNVSFGLATRSGKPATTLGGVGILNMDSVGTIVASNDGTLSEMAYVHLCRMATVIASDCAFIMRRARRKLHLRFTTVPQARSEAHTLMHVSQLKPLETSPNPPMERFDLGESTRVELSRSGNGLRHRQSESIDAMRARLKPARRQSFQRYFVEKFPLREVKVKMDDSTRALDLKSTYRFITSSAPCAL